MKVEVLQENLVKALSWVGRFVPSKSSMPVLSMVKIEAQKGRLLLSATNMESGIEVEVGARVTGEGVVVVPAKLVHEYVSLLPAGKVELERVGVKLKLEAKGHRASVAGEKEDEFPELPEFGGKGGMELSSGDLERVVRLVGFSASSEVARPVLAALMMMFRKGGRLKVVATDGYRLSLLDKIKVEGKMEGAKVLVPARVVEEVSRLVGEEGAERVGLSVSEKQKTLVFVFGKVKVVTRLVEGDFPQYERIMPKESGVELRVGKSELAEAVRTASLFARENAHIVVWRVEKGRLVIRSQAVKLGEQESVVEVEMVKGEGGEIAFNGRFLLDLLGSVSDGEVGFSMQEALTPGMFTSGDKNFLHVIMPVRTQEAGKQ